MKLNEFLKTYVDDDTIVTIKDSYIEHVVKTKIEDIKYSKIMDILDLDVIVISAEDNVLVIEID